MEMDGWILMDEWIEMDIWMSFDGWIDGIRSTPMTQWLVIGVSELMGKERVLLPECYSCWLSSIDASIRFKSIRQCTKHQ